MKLNVFNMVDLFWNL